MNWAIIKSDELYHHGILGMKWGKRNGPPYPLGASDHSASEKKAGWRKSVSGGRNEELYDRKTRKKASKEMYRQLKKMTRGKGSAGLEAEKFRNNAVIQEIRNKNKKAKDKMESTEYEEYNAYDDPKVMDATDKEFKRQFGRDPDFMNKADDMSYDIIMDDMVKKYGKKQGSNWEQNWDKYYEGYKQHAEDVLGKYSDKQVYKVKGDTWTKNQAKYKEIVRDICFALDNADSKKKIRLS